MTIVSAAGNSVPLDVVQGVEFDLDFLDADATLTTLVDLTGYTFSFILKKKLSNGTLSTLNTDRVDWSSYVSVLSSDTQFGSNCVARVLVPASATSQLSANSVYAYTIASTNAGVSREWFRDELKVRASL